MRKPWFKVIFSIAIIIASIPSVVTDIREGFSGTYTHYGTLLIGISYFIESLFWVLEMWVNDINKIIDDSLDDYEYFETEDWKDIQKWIIDPEAGNKDAWDEEWKRTNKDNE